MNRSNLYQIVKDYEKKGLYVVEQNTETAIDYYKRAVEAGTGVEEYGEDEHAVLAKKRLQELGVSCTINTP